MWEGDRAMEAITAKPIMFKMSDKALKKVLESGKEMLECCTHNRTFTGNAKQGWWFFFWKKNEKKSPISNSRTA